jgi:hypothetical protein
MTGHSVDTRCEKEYTATDFYGTRADCRRGSILSSGTSGPSDLSAAGNQVLDLKTAYGRQLCRKPLAVVINATRLIGSLDLHANGFGASECRFAYDADKSLPPVARNRDWTGNRDQAE